MNQNFAEEMKSLDVWNKNFNDWDDILERGILECGLIPVQNKAMISLLRTGSLIEEKVNLMLEQFDLSISQKSVLEALYYCQKPYLTQLELSRYTYSSKANVSTLISRMEVKGYIVRTENPKNKREKRVSLTKKGISKIEELYNVFRYHKMDFISEREADSIINITKKVRNNLKEHN